MTKTVHLLIYVAPFELKSPPPQLSYILQLLLLSCNLFGAQSAVRIKWIVSLVFLLELYSFKFHIDQFHMIF